MVLLYIQQANKDMPILVTGISLAEKFKKKLGIVSFVASSDAISKKNDEIEAIKPSGEISVWVKEGDVSQLGDFCEEIEASFLLLQLSSGKSKTAQQLLNACRTLRIPYLLYKASFPLLQTEKILVPVTFLEEEVEKAQFAAAFGRFYGSQITLLQANDYGSKASTTVIKMKLFFDKFNLQYQVQQGKSDSFKLEKEAVNIAEEEHYGLILLSASREYGLDDLIFGPRERHAIQKSSVPVLLINPRGDLYALCE